MFAGPVFDIPLFRCHRNIQFNSCFHCCLCLDDWIWELVYYYIKKDLSLTRFAQVSIMISGPVCSVHGWVFMSYIWYGTFTYDTDEEHYTIPCRWCGGSIYLWPFVAFSLTIITWCSTYPRCTHCLHLWCMVALVCLTSITRYHQWWLWRWLAASWRWSWYGKFLMYLSFCGHPSHLFWVSYFLFLLMPSFSL
jgi:hypothetical protein